MDENERLIIINELSIVNYAMLSIDTDRTVIKSLEKIHSMFSKEYDLCFANGGSR